MGMLSELEKSRQPSKNMPSPPADTQRTCIDLPGERAQCFLYKSKLQVVLRKHRDVIFDIHMGSGATYTIEADESDFYDAIEKKLNEVKRKHQVTFKDGERAHLWLSRSFSGHLILKSNGKVMARYSPRSMDPRFYDDDPKTKPAPIMIVMKKEEEAPSKATPSGAASKPAVPASTLNTSPKSSDRFPVGGGNYPSHSPNKGTQHLSERGYFDIGYQDLMPTQREAQTMHILEVVDMKSAPKEVLQFFMDGGEALGFDSSGIMSQNWILSQMFGAHAWGFDNRAWANELMGTKFRLQRVVHKSGPKLYIIFKGSLGLREVMNASRYAVTNTKVLKITAGAGAGGQVWGAARGALNDSVKMFAKENGRMVIKGSGIAVLLTIGMDTAEWYKDYSETGADGKPKRDFIDLFAKIGMDLVKAGISAAVASVAVSSTLTMLFGAAAVAAFPVTWVVVGTIAIAIIVAYGLDWVDKKIAESVNAKDVTDIAAKSMRSSADYLKSKQKKEDLYGNYPYLFYP